MSMGETGIDFQNGIMCGIGMMNQDRDSLVEGANAKQLKSRIEFIKE